MIYNNYDQFAADMKSAIAAGKLVKGLIKFAPAGLMALYPETERSFIVWSSSYKEGAAVKGMRYIEYWEAPSDNPNVRNVDPDWLTNWDGNKDLTEAVKVTPIQSCVLFEAALWEKGGEKEFFPNRLAAMKEMLDRYSRESGKKITAKERSELLEKGWTSFGDSKGNVAILDGEGGKYKDIAWKIEEYPVVRHNEMTGEINELIMEGDTCYIKEVKKF